MGLPTKTTLESGEELHIRLELNMHEGMEGPHLFRLRASAAEEGGESLAPLELYVKGTFGPGAVH